MGKALSILLMAVLLLASCTVTESMTINNQNSFGSVSEIKAEPFFVSVLEDFAEFLPENGKSIMDSSIEGFAGQLRETAGAEAVSYEKTGENEYTLVFSTNDLTTLLGSFGAADQSFVKIGENSFSFYLDINNYPELKTIVPFLADPNFEVYGPEYNQGMSEDDYLDMIYFLLGEDGPDAIRNGLISVTMNVPGTLTEVTGGEKLDDNSVRFSFPIIDFLLLNEPIEFSASWE